MFDFIVVDGGKPKFFIGSEPMKRCDPEIANYKGAVIESLSEEKGKIFIGGNAKLFQDFLRLI